MFRALVAHFQGALDERNLTEHIVYIYYDMNLSVLEHNSLQICVRPPEMGK
jgi:hypothetical protein